MSAATSRPSLIMFDLDGTLVDSSGDIADALRKSLAELDFPLRTEEEVTAMIGDGLTRLLERALGPEHDDPSTVLAVRQVFRKHYGANLVARTVLYPGIEALVSRLAMTTPLAVATNKPGDWARTILTELGIASHFRLVVGDGDPEVSRKPAPTMLLWLCEKLSIAPGRAVLVGDSHIDVEAGRAAGVKTIVVSWGYDRLGEAAAARPDHMVSDVAALEALL